VPVNYRLFELVNPRAGRADGIDDVMEFAATWLIYAVFAVAAVLVAVAVHRRRFRPVLEIGAVLVLAFVAAIGREHLSRQLRPFQTHEVHQLIAHGGGVSMPSDHATAAFAVAFAIGVFLNRQWGLALAVVALLIGLSRVWVGVHYPGDILAAGAIAALATLEVKVCSMWTWQRLEPIRVRPGFRRSAALTIPIRTPCCSVSPRSASRRVVEARRCLAARPPHSMAASFRL
jgi:undecaprenyl-diphosphatase